MVFSAHVLVQHIMCVGYAAGSEHMACEAWE